MYVLDWFSSIRIKPPAWLICFLSPRLQLTADISCLQNTECPSSSSVSHHLTALQRHHSHFLVAALWVLHSSALVLWEICHSYETIHYTFNCHRATLCKSISLYFMLIWIHFSLRRGFWCIMPEPNIILSFQGDIVIWCKSTDHLWWVEVSVCHFGSL